MQSAVGTSSPRSQSVNWVTIPAVVDLRDRITPHMQRDYVVRLIFPLRMFLQGDMLRTWVCDITSCARQGLPGVGVSLRVKIHPHFRCARPQHSITTLSHHHTFASPHFHITTSTMPGTSDTSNTSDTPPPTPGPSKKNHPPNPQQTTITADECFTNFKKYITNERPGLSAFYDDLALRELAKKAQDMGEKLMVKKCGKEIAMQLSLLTLYDIALLLGLNPLVCFLGYMGRG